MSRQLDSILKGLTIFNDGMQELGISRATDEAEQQLDAARDTFKITGNLSAEEAQMEAERFEDARNRISQSLATRLSGMGASATQIQGATGFGLNFAQEKQFELTQQQLETQLTQSVLKAKASGAENYLKMQEHTMKQQDHQRDYVNDFKKAHEDMVEQIRSAKNASAILRRGVDNETNARAIRPLLAKMLQPGNLTEAEQAAFAGNTSLLNWAKSSWKRLISGEGPMTEKDQAQLREYIDTIQESNIQEFEIAKSAYKKEYAPDMKAIGLTEQGFDRKLDTLKFVPPSERISKALDTSSQLINRYKTALEKKNEIGLSQQQIQNYSKALIREMAKEHLNKKRLKRLRGN